MRLRATSNYFALFAHARACIRRPPRRMERERSRDLEICDRRETLDPDASDPTPLALLSLGTCFLERYLRGRDVLVARFFPRVQCSLYPAGLAVHGDDLLGRVASEAAVALPAATWRLIVQDVLPMRRGASRSRLKAALRLRTSRARTRFSKSRSRQYRAAASPALRCRARRPVSEVNKGIVGI